MTILDLKTQIKNKVLKSFYIFTGDEIEIQRVYINKIAEVKNSQVVRADCIDDIWQEATSPSLFDNRYVYVLRDDKTLQLNTTIQKRIEENALGEHTLILLLTNVDKRTNFYKSHKDEIIVFEHMSVDILVKYIRRDTTLNRANCERLVAICENDYSRILLEIDKILRYHQIMQEKSSEAVSMDDVFISMLNDGSIYIPPKDAIFDLVDAILRRQVVRVYNLLEQCYAVGEANMVILSVLYNNAKQVLQVQSCTSGDISKSTGLTSWQVKCAKEKSGYYRDGELVYILRQIHKIQRGIITGQIEDENAVEYLLVTIL